MSIFILLFLIILFVVLAIGYLNVSFLIIAGICCSLLFAGIAYLVTANDVIDTHDDLLLLNISKSTNVKHRVSILKRIIDHNEDLERSVLLNKNWIFDPYIDDKITNLKPIKIIIRGVK